MNQHIALFTKSQYPQLTQKLHALSQARSRWGGLSLKEKQSYLKKILNRLPALDHRAWGEASALRQGYRLDTIWGQQSAGAETLLNILVIRNTLTSLIQTYQSLIKTGTPPKLDKRGVYPLRSDSTRTRNKADASQRTAYHVFPRTLKERLSLNGLAKIQAQVWTTASEETLYTSPTSKPELCLILGAGNQTFLALGDLLYKMFVEGHLCILKHHPIRAFSEPFINELFQDLIKEDFFFALQTDLPTSQWLCYHDLIDSVHMTGGTATHDAIVWGQNKEEQEQNKKQSTPLLHKPMTSELGCVTPWMILPGTQWSQKELNHQAGHLITGVIGQNSCNCLSPKLLLLDEDWPQSDAFIQAIRSTLKKCKLPPPYYPNTHGRYQGFVDRYQEQEQKGGLPVLESIHPPSIPASSGNVERFGDPLPWLLIHLDEESDEYALQNEAFAPVLAIYKIKSQNHPLTFLQKCTSLVNERVWGTLSCTLIVHPQLEKQKEVNQALESALGELNYGSIGVNIWTSMIYALESCTWGGSSNERLDAVESGIGVVRNTLMIDQVDRSIVKAPFINPAQIVPNAEGHFPVKPGVFYGLASFIVRPSLRSFLGLIWSFIRPTSLNNEIDESRR